MYNHPQADTLYETLPSPHVVHLRELSPTPWQAGSMLAPLWFAFWNNFPPADTTQLSCRDKGRCGLMSLTQHTSIWLLFSKASSDANGLKSHWIGCLQTTFPIWGLHRGLDAPVRWACCEETACIHPRTWAFLLKYSLLFLYYIHSSTEISLLPTRHDYGGLLDKDYYHTSTKSIGHIRSHASNNHCYALRHKQDTLASGRSDWSR